jgi:hypothetical protein
VKLAAHARRRQVRGRRHVSGSAGAWSRLEAAARSALGGCASLVLATSGILGLAACSPRNVGSRPPSTTQADWQEARARLAVLRAGVPDRPYGIVVRVSLREPKSGRTFVARGALAVDPRRALRMILVGPGGGTALDAWVTPEAYRFEVPTIGLLRRGGVSPEPGLPVGFFRWWFLSPLEGRLLASFVPDEPKKGSRSFILRRGAATVIVEDAQLSTGLELRATQRSPGVFERLSFRGQELSPHAGDRAEYEEAGTGVRAEVLVESVDADAPESIAFRDPDHGGER